MKKSIKFALAGLLLGGAVTTASGCAYAGVATTQDGMAVVPRNDTALYGILRKVYVCQVTPNGLSNCKSKENP